MTDRQALFVGDVLATGYWAARISEITEEDTVLIIGAGPLQRIEEAYDLFEHKHDGVIKVAIEC